VLLYRLLDRLSRTIGNIIDNYTIKPLITVVLLLLLLLSPGVETFQCHSCRNAILDRFVLKINDRTWHQECLRCSDCRRRFIDRCYTRGDQVFCRDDYFRYGIGLQQVVSFIPSTGRLVCSTYEFFTVRCDSGSSG